MICDVQEKLSKFQQIIDLVICWDFRYSVMNAFVLFDENIYFGHR